MEAKAKKICSIVFLVVVALGLVLTSVGMYVGQMSVTMMGKTTIAKLFDEGYGKYGAPSNLFAILSFGVLSIGLVIALVAAILRVANKNMKGLTIAGAAVTIIGVVLVLVSGFMLVSGFNDLLKAKAYSVGIGVWLAFAGGLMGVIGSVLPLVGPFKE